MRARVLLASILVLSACSERARPPEVARIDAEVAGAARPWTGLDPLDGPDDFRFVVVTDRTGEHRAGVFEGAMPKINVLQPAFVMSVGDLIEGYTDNKTELDREWDEFQSFVGRLQMPFFYVPGNHDMSNRVMADAWHERFGPTFYHFRYKGVLFIALNSELFGMVHEPDKPLPGPETQAQQMAWLERVLAENRDARWTLLFLHQPLWDKKIVPADWTRVEEQLQGRPHTVFAGHFHRYTSHERHGSNYITLATTGGGSLMRGLMFGEFDHVALVTMKREGPVIANLLLDGIQDKDVRTIATREAVEQLEKAVTGYPLEASSDPFRTGTARFSIANGGVAPLEVDGVVDAGRQLHTSDERVRRSIAPGETAQVEIGLSAVGRVPLSALEPGRVHWKLRSQAAGGRPVEIASESLLLPERRFAIPRLKRRIEVDGALGDWPALPLVVGTPVQVDGAEQYSGPADASFRWGIGWDERALYIAVDAVDDSPLFSTAKIMRDQDHLGFSIDARPDPARSANEDMDSALKNGMLRALLQANVLPVEPAQDLAMTWFAGGLPDGAHVASQRTPRGYTAELSIPAAELDRRAGGRWRELRINVSQTDFDEDEPGHSVLWFRPSRFGLLAIPGTGTFERR